MLLSEPVARTFTESLLAFCIFGPFPLNSFVICSSTDRYRLSLKLSFIVHCRQQISEFIKGLGGSFSLLKMSKSISRIKFLLWVISICKISCWTLHWILKLYQESAFPVSPSRDSHEVCLCYLFLIIQTHLKSNFWPYSIVVSINRSWTPTQSE